MTNSRNPNSTPLNGRHHPDADMYAEANIPAHELRDTFVSLLRMSKDPNKVYSISYKPIGTSFSCTIEVGNDGATIYLSPQTSINEARPILNTLMTAVKDLQHDGLFMKENYPIRISQQALSLAKNKSTLFQASTSLSNEKDTTSSKELPKKKNGAS